MPGSDDNPRTRNRRFRRFPLLAAAITTIILSMMIGIALTTTTTTTPLGRVLRS